ncbi:hypothetical protein NUU61_009984 [Penicillium alfredii]|uniref:Uncharacterized protein n=1 Tax=Penicillium alfredii TaxID=1506179 RepID=A0A9W9JU77_9EURO|nr:uncharacterized protein NUU61_009984 [Penicillium alfredii]KAJ5081720.1 hypothetical protein NUU61_009984 [Penicillium alfredii]
MNDTWWLKSAKPLVGALSSKDANAEFRSADTCKVCNTDYELKVSPFGDARALVVTRWINLGSGQDPLDPRWLMHAREPTSKGPVWLEKSDMAISPRVLFETACSSDQSLEARPSRNFAYLQDRRYEEVLKT